MQTRVGVSQLLRPRSVAIVGASAAPHKAGGRRWLSAISEPGHPRLFPVTRSGDSLNGYRTYRSLAHLPEPVDLAVIMVPADAVQDAVADCARLGVPGVVVVSAGFAERGAEGAALEAALAARLRATGGRLLGPNSAGLYSAAGGVNLLGWRVSKGPIGLVTQSGNVALTFTRHARAKRSGFSAILALGNAADLTLSELVEVLIEDAATRSVLVYCEGFAQGDGRRLIEIVRNAREKKPVVVLKAGVSEAGARAVQSHTGSLAGDDRLVDELLAGAGILRAAETEQAFDLALALAAPKGLLGRDIAVLSDGGGHAALVADCAGRHGLTLARFSPETLARLRALLPARSGVENPVDFAGAAESDPGSVAAAITICLDDPNVRGIVLAGHFGGYHLMTEDETTRSRVAQQETDAALRIAAAARDSAKLLVVHSEHAERGLATLTPLHEAEIPMFAGLESAARAAAALALRGGALEGWKAAAFAAAGELEAGRPGGARQLTEPEARERISRAGIPVPPFRTAGSAEEARAAHATLAAPLAMKLVSATALHKSDIGGVILDVGSAEAAEAAFRRLMSVARERGIADAGVLLTPMIPAGIECLIGGAVDASFGPVVSFGAGGIWVELLADVVFRAAPVDETEARRMIAGTRVFRLLQGYRGRSPADLAALAALIAAVSRFVAETSGLIALDLNPVIVDETGAHLADVRMIVEPGALRSNAGAVRRT